MKVPYSYLYQQFQYREDIISAIRDLSHSGEFTLGKPVEEFENNFARFIDSKYAVGMNSGTDALIQILRALNIGHGDEVITVPNTFIATAGAIAVVGAKPVFVDVNDEYLMDITEAEHAITGRTKAIIPVHLTGNMVDMQGLSLIASRFDLDVIEDAAQAVDADINGKKSGTWGIAGAFSFHPLKNLNGWGDGGMVTTNHKELAEKLRLLRNHGLANRDCCEIFAYNTRLHSLQAVVLNHLLLDIERITYNRIANAELYDMLLCDIDEITIPARNREIRQVYHTYVIQAENRDELIKFLEKNDIEPKVHYPIPIHLQPAAKKLNYREGDFPVCEEQAKRIITLPVHQYLSSEKIEFVCEKVKEFYSKK